MLIFKICFGAILSVVGVIGWAIDWSVDRPHLSLLINLGGVLVAALGVLLMSDTI